MAREEAERATWWHEVLFFGGGKRPPSRGFLLMAFKYLKAFKKHPLEGLGGFLFSHVFLVVVVLRISEFCLCFQAPFNRRVLLTLMAAALLPRDREGPHGVCTS